MKRPSMCLIIKLKPLALFRCIMSLCRKNSNLVLGNEFIIFLYCKQCRHSKEYFLVAFPNISKAPQVNSLPPSKSEDIGGPAMNFPGCSGVFKPGIENNPGILCTTMNPWKVFTSHSCRKTFKNLSSKKVLS